MFQGPGAFSHVKKTGMLAGNFGKDQLTGITVREWLEIFFFTPSSNTSNDIDFDSIPSTVRTARDHSVAFLG